MWLKLWKLVHKQQPPPLDYTTFSTSPGDLEGLPDTCFPLWLPQLDVQHAITGPGAGVADLQDAFGDLDILWQQQEPQEGTTVTTDSTSASSWPPPPEATPSAAAVPEGAASPPLPCRLWGCATSLYDVDPTTGRPAGEPVADIYAGVQLPGGCSLMAVADGVNWGERPRRAARAAVYGVIRHVLVQLLHKYQEQEVNSNQVLSVMRQALSTAQRLILSTEGTLTTLVAALVAPARPTGDITAAAAAAIGAAAGSTGASFAPSHHKQPASAAASRHGSYTGRLSGVGDRQQQQQPQPYVVCALAVGDSPAYVWRQRQGVVEELTAAGRHAEDGAHRDPRMCPGCLGYASGEDPDLTNLTLSVTHIEAGDVVYLTSDGIADNFDPVVCKRAVASSAHLAGTISYSPGNSPASHKELLLGEVAGEQQHLVAVSPVAAHQLALESMAVLLNGLHGGLEPGPQVCSKGAASAAACEEGGAGGSNPQLEGLASSGGGSSTQLDQLGATKEHRSTAASAISHGLSKLCLGAHVKHAAPAVAVPAVPGGASTHMQRASASSTSFGSTAAAAASGGTGGRVGPLPLVSSAAVGKCLIDYVQQLTAPHRALIEERSRQVLAMQRQRQQQQEGEEVRHSSSSSISNGSGPLAQQQKRTSTSSLSAEEQFLMDLANVPGKLDHATVLAFSP